MVGHPSGTGLLAATFAQPLDMDFIQSIHSPHAVGTWGRVCVYHASMSPHAVGTCGDRLIFLKMDGRYYRRRSGVAAVVDIIYPRGD